jgi:cell division protein FtsL
MRKSTLLWLALAAFCGITLFHTSQKVHDHREKLAALTRDIGREEESLRVLQAEWSYLNQPRRLEKLAKQYLKLAPLKGAQFIRPEDIALRPVAADMPGSALSIDAPEYPLPNPLPKGEGTRIASSPSPALRERVGERVLRHETPTRKFGDVMKSLGAGP